MATATITYNLDNNKDKMDYYRANISLDMASLLWEYDQYLREEYKYGENEVAYKFREKFREFLNAANIDLDRIVK